jgi:hypothetical protein
MEFLLTIPANIEIELGIRVCDDLAQLAYGIPWHDMIGIESAGMDFFRGQK